jgi:hypothetical protein
MGPWYLVLISALFYATPLFAQTTPPDADLGQPVRVTITDQDVARHMPPSMQEEWRRYVRDGELLKQEVSRMEPGSPEHRAMQRAYFELKRDFQEEFAPFLGISGTSVIAYGTPKPTGAEIAEEVLELRAYGFTGEMPGYWVVTEPGDLQWFSKDPALTRTIEELGPAAGKTVEGHFKYEDRDRPQEGEARETSGGGGLTPPPTTQPVCTATTGPFGLTGCP